MKPLPRKCIICGKEFTPPKRHEPKYCSKSCIWKATKGPEFNVRIGRQYREKIGNTERGRGKGKTYRKFLGRHEHRVIAEAILGRPLIKGEIVHHLDGNKLNNDMDNILITDRPGHMRKHGLGIPGMKLWWKPWEKRRYKNEL